jgi:hypothetical protein
VPIAAGEALYLCYVSANRDEEVFDDPFHFGVGRDPNKHLTFGYAVHFCLDAALARMEVNSFFSELLPRLRSIECTAEPELIATTFVGRLKRLPIRYSLRWPCSVRAGRKGIRRRLRTRIRGGRSPAKWTGASAPAGRSAGRWHAIDRPHLIPRRLGYRITRRTAPRIAGRCARAGW